jgi:hypothetical protein
MPIVVDNREAKILALIWPRIQRMCEQEGVVCGLQEDKVGFGRLVATVAIPIEQLVSAFENDRYDTIEAAVKAAIRATKRKVP